MYQRHQGEKIQEEALDARIWLNFGFYLAKILYYCYNQNVIFPFPSNSTIFYQLNERSDTLLRWEDFG